MKNRAFNFLRPKRVFSNKKRPKRGVMFWVATFLFLSTLAIIGLAGYYISGSSDRLAYGVRIVNLEFGGLTAPEARALLAKRAAELRLSYQVGEGQLDLTQQTLVDGQPIFTVDYDRTMAAAMAVGHQTDQLAAMAERLSVAAVGKDVPVSVNLDRQRLDAYILTNVGKYIDPTVDARLHVRLNSRTNEADVTIDPEKTGYRLDTDLAGRLTLTRLQNFQGGVIKVPVLAAAPAITADDLRPLTSEAAAVVDNAPLILTAKGYSWVVSRSLAADWITAVREPGSPGKVHLALDAARAQKFLAAKDDSVYTAPSDADIEIKDGRVTKIVPSVDGQELDAAGGVAAMEKALFRTEGEGTVALPLKPVPPKISTEEASPYGIKEIIGIGESNFRGSPKNRIHNITVGAAAMNGVVVAPDEIFSTIKTLGKIDASSGYLQELVIKDNKTLPEYGGGLCQIGTTTFRATLNSGLPILERQNHSYRVPYYERDGDGKTIGPGTDATIYDPAPDFKFRNDTGHYIVIMTDIQGTRLRFTFWGVKDGRAAEQSPVRVYNEVPPPPKVETPTDDLPPGKVKCTESAHAGADATFTYTVTYADGTVKTKNFYSHYKPWGEVCLIGRDPNAPKLPADVSSAPVSADATGAAGD